MNRVIRIGTRDSELALWQAGYVRQQLLGLGYSSELIPVKSAGDEIADQPLHEFGISGIFTKALDIAMLRGEIDIAVHSLKDVPTVMPEGIVQAAVLKRASPGDILVHKGLDFLNAEGVIATGSLRRRAQWLHRYPLHQVEDLRGNVNSRLRKLEENDWNAAIFAAAGLERINLLPDMHVALKWMVPAPAQGALVVVAMKGDAYCLNALQPLNDDASHRCTSIEREFLRELEGGCSAPIGALATITGNTLHFTGILLALDGQEKVGIERNVLISQSSGSGKRWASEVLGNGGRELREAIGRAMNK